MECFLKDSESLIKMHSSEDFKAQKKHFMRLTLDVSNALRAAYAHAVIAKSYADNCMTIQSTDDFDQSVLAVSFLYDQGIHNPIKRELRYLIESMVKYVYIDQKNPEASLVEKVSLTNQLPPSIDMRKDIKLEAFHAEDRQHLVNELYDAYRQCCAYVHVSPKQVEERLRRRDRGGALGYETTDELRKLNRLIFRVYDIALKFRPAGRHWTLFPSPFIPPSAFTVTGFKRLFPLPQRKPLFPFPPEARIFCISCSTTV